MNSKSRHITAAISLFVVFAITQVYVGASFAGSAPIPRAGVAIPPQQPTGILVTNGNREITINGATAISGTTLISGATVETPKGTGASVKLGSRGSVDIDPATKLVLAFNENSVEVMLFYGCVVLHTKKGTAGEVDTAQGVVGKTDPRTDGTIRVCRPEGAPATIVTSSVVAAAAGAAGGFGLGTAAALAIVFGSLAAAVIIPTAIRGDNPSPSGS